MRTLPISMLSRACRLYLELAYPIGPESIPERCRVFWELDPSLPVDDVVPPAPLSASIAQQLQTPPGYSFRLGCAHFPHMKLTTQKFPSNDTPRWVFGVDTHDAYFLPAEDSPELSGWQHIVTANKILKEKIEATWVEHGILTHTSILRQELEAIPM